ncbi:GNAT family protein [Streptomyces sp. NPDC051940]|uniref:GNAT family N-acetyltransferase n=1 Tax=Streptomyces sp. NPDC051940 TaxID=3155675 RepID=UPI0034213B1B
MAQQSVRLRPVAEEDLELFRRFGSEPGLIGLDWGGFRNPHAPARRFAEDGYLAEDNGRLMVETAEGETAGFVGWTSRTYTGPRSAFWEIGIALLPEFRGRGLGWRAQAALCDYLFMHTPVHRIEAATHPENAAEQRALEKAGFTFEGTVRGAEFRAGQWRDGLVYGRLRTDPAPGV